MPRKQDILNEALQHQVRVEGLAVDIADRAKRKLARMGSAALKRLSGSELTDLVASDIEKVLREIQRDELQTMVDALDTLTPQLEKLAAYEATYTTKALRAASERIKILSLETGEAYQAALTNPLAATGQMLDAFTADWTERQAAKVSQLIGKGYANGWTNQQMAQAIRGTKATGYQDGLIEDIGKSADLVVRTSVQHVAGAARMETWAKNDDVLEGYRVLATLDTHTCPICAAIDNDQVYQTGEGPTPPFHIGCLPGDALVTARGGFSAKSKRWYDGDVVVVGTSKGQRVTCTPNHPILTRSGWVPARLLHVGGNVVCDLRGYGPVLGNQNHEHVPARIEEITNPAWRPGEVRAAEVPVSAEDFHGDGEGSKVAVIWADGLLLDAMNAALGKHRAQRRFLRGHVGQRLLPSGGHVDPLFQGVAYALNRLVARFGALLPGLRCCAACGYPVGFAASTQWYPGANQAPGYARSGNSELAGQCERGFSRHVVGYDGGAVYRPRLLADLKPARHEEGAYRRGPYSALLGESTNRLPADVFLDDIVGVQRFRFHGFVYNLQTPSEDYTANGIVVHNCRCTTVPVLKEQYQYLSEGEERSSDKGPVDANLTYYEWLKQQPAAFQDEALGPTRGQLLRDGGLSAERFGRLNLGRDFKPMTLDEMRRKEPGAFRRAGL